MKLYQQGARKRKKGIMRIIFETQKIPNDACFLKFNLLVLDESKFKYKHELLLYNRYKQRNWKIIC